MKKILLIFLLAIYSSASYSQLGVTFPERENVQLKHLYSDTVRQIDATHNTENGYDMIYDYVNNTKWDKIWKPSLRYFTVDASTLLLYLISYQVLYDNHIIDRQIQHVAFMFGKNGNNIEMMICGTDENFSNIYLPYGVLSKCLPCNSNTGDCLANINLTPNNIEYGEYIGDNPIEIYNKKFPPKREISTLSSTYSTYISEQTAKQWAKNYKDNLDKDIDHTTSFVFDVGTLANYLYNTNGIQDLQLLLGRKNLKDGLISLILVANDKDGKQIYIKDGSNYPAVLEHCYPCPSECTDISFKLLAKLHAEYLKSKNYKISEAERRRVEKVIKNKQQQNNKH